MLQGSFDKQVSDFQQYSFDSTKCIIRSRPCILHILTCDRKVRHLFNSQLSFEANQPFLTFDMHVFRSSLSNTSITSTLPFHRDTHTKLEQGVRELHLYCDHFITNDVRDEF